MRRMRGVLYLCLMTLSSGVQGEEDEIIDDKDPYKVKFKMEVLKKPETCDRETNIGDKLTVKFTGKVARSGVVFDTSENRRKPFSFTLGMTEVIPGWKFGLEDMCVGEIRHLIVPPQYAYKDLARGKVPPHAVLEFEIELMEIGEGDTPEKMFKHMDADGDGRVSKKEIKEWILVNAEMNVPAEEYEKLTSNPDSLNPTIEGALKEDDANGNGYIEWFEVQTRWNKHLYVHDEL